MLHRPGMSILTSYLIEDMVQFLEVLLSFSPRCASYPPMKVQYYGTLARNL